MPNRSRAASAVPRRPCRHGGRPDGKRALAYGKGFSAETKVNRKAILSQHELLVLRRSLIEADAQIERGDSVTPEESDADIEELARTLQGR